MKTLLLLIVTTLSLVSVNAQVVLNEIYTDPGTGKKEFYEFYNTGISQAPENLDSYTIISFYEESGKSGFYILDMPNMAISARSFFVGAASNTFNVQGQNNLSASFSWNNIPAGGSLTKWENNGIGYTSKPVPSDLNDLFVKRSGSGAGYHIFIYKNGILINGLVGGTIGNTMPSYIKAMPSLFVDMMAPAVDFTADFSSIMDNEVE